MTLDPHEYYVDESLPDASKVEAMCDMEGSDDVFYTAPTRCGPKSGGTYTVMVSEIKVNTDPLDEWLDRLGTSLQYDG